MKRSKKETRGGAAKQTLAVEMRGDAWEIVHPRCARRRREDIEEIADMLASGEIDIAKDELVWLLSECPDFLEAARATRCDCDGVRRSSISSRTFWTGVRTFAASFGSGWQSRTSSVRTARQRILLGSFERAALLFGSDGSPTHGSRCMEATATTRPIRSTWNCPDCWHAKKDLSDRAMSNTLEEIACRLDTVKSFPEIYEWRLLYDDHELLALSNA